MLENSSIGVSSKDVSKDINEREKTGLFSRDFFSVLSKATGLKSKLGLLNTFPVILTVKAI